jgi:hypothetical protein
VIDPFEIPTDETHDGFDPQQAVERWAELDENRSVPSGADCGGESRGDD